MLDDQEVTLPDLFAGLIVLSAFLMLLISAVLIATVRRQHTTQQSIFSSPPRVSIACPGGGVYFWWQIGALKRLLELYDLPDGVPLSGASAGALAVCLSQCSVDPATAYKIAFGLAEEANVFRNPLGLCGKWGRLVYAWLDQLLPMDAGERCSGRCRVVVTRCSHATPLRPLRIEHIDAFSSRAALIDALMASTHIPFFMDGRPTSARLGGATVDGALLGFLGVTTPLGLLLDDPQRDAPSAVVLSHKRDAPFLAACKANGWTPVKIDGTDRFMGFGAAYVEREAARGAQGDLAMLSDFLKPKHQNCGVVPVRPLARTATDAVARGRSRSQRSPVRA